MLIEFAAYVREPQFDPTSSRQVSFAQWLAARPELHRLECLLAYEFRQTHCRRHLSQLHAGGGQLHVVLPSQ